MYDQYQTVLRLLAEAVSLIQSRQMKSCEIGWYLGSEMTKLESAYSEKCSLPWRKQIRSVVQQSMTAQMKVVGDTPDTTVHAIKSRRLGSSYTPTMQNKRADWHKQEHECWSCGQMHDITNKEACPAYRKEYKKHHKNTILHLDAGARCQLHKGYEP